MNKNDTLKQICKMISSGEIPAETYNYYLSKTPIGFMNYKDLCNYFNLDNKSVNNTAKQLVEQLGNSTEITIMADIVHGLDFEYEKLLQENKELKKYCCKRNDCSGRLKENNKLTDSEILTEFEKWLEEKINQLKNEADEKVKIGFIKEVDLLTSQIIIFKKSLDKLQELKEGKK